MPLTDEERRRLQALAEQARQRYRARPEDAPSTTWPAPASSTSPTPVPLADLARQLETRLRALIEARRAARRAAGIQCLACDDTGRTPTGRPCSCPPGQELARQEREREHARVRAAWEHWEATLDRELGIPPRLARLPAAVIEATPQWRQVRAWFARRQPGEGLALIGPFGCGKSTLAAHLLRTAVRALAHPPQPEDAALALPPPARRLGRFVTLTGLLEALRPTADGSRPETLAEYQQLPWLVLDDLGAERLTPWGADRLYELLNDRVNEERPLVVTSNLDLNALAARWDAQLGDESGQRLVNRLLEGTVVLRWPTDAPNYRIRTPTGTCP